MGRRDHLGPREACLIEDLVDTDLMEERQKEKEAAELGLKLSGGEIQTTNVCYGSNLRPYARRPLRHRLAWASGQTLPP